MDVFWFLVILLDNGHQPDNRPVAFLPTNWKSRDGASFTDHLCKIAPDVFPAHNSISQ
jgi:hypothetical protein